MNLLDFLFPKTCLECGKYGKYICETCLKKVRLGGWRGNTYSIFRYEGVIRKAIIALKYKYSYQIATELSDICVQKLNSLAKPDPALQDYSLIPIPLHYLRKNFRGFNQSELMGKQIAEKLGWQFEPNLLIKNVSTKPQVGLKGSARRSNLQNVFSINPHCSLSTVHGSLVVFDDVATTGSTIREATNTLLLAGYKNIYGLTIAR